MFFSAISDLSDFALRFETTLKPVSVLMASVCVQFVFLRLIFLFPIISDEVT